MRKLLLALTLFLGGCIFGGEDDETTESTPPTWQTRTYYYNGVISQSNKSSDGNSYMLVAPTINDSSSVHVMLRKTSNNIWFAPTVWGYGNLFAYVFPTSTDEFLGYEYKVTVVNTFLR